MRATFRFNGVGQGLFYTADIDGFQFVYDCGSLSTRDSLRYAIGSYRADTIDLLIISHFDQDHINGLDGLLRELILEQEPWLKDDIVKGRLEIKDHGSVAIAKKWIFRFFNYRLPNEKLENLKNCLCANIGRVEALDVCEIVRDKQLREKLGECYKKAMDKNTSSLVVYHGPGNGTGTVPIRGLSPGALR